jgi:hypothetical protein
VQGVVSAQDSSETSGLQRAQADLAQTVASLMNADRLWSGAEVWVGSSTLALPLCTAAHPLHTRFTAISYRCLDF